MLYSFKEEYNVEDMSVSSLRKIFSRMENGKGQEYANKYCTYSLVSNYRIVCSDQARADIYCGGLKSDLKEAQECRESYMKSLNAAAKSCLGYLSIIAVVLISVFNVQL